MEKIKITDSEQLYNFKEYVDGEICGEIQLAIPLVNTCMGTGQVALVTGVEPKQIKGIIGYTHGVVKDPGSSDKKEGDIITFKAYEKIKTEQPGMEVLMGAYGLEYLLGRIDMKEKMLEARKEESDAMLALEELGEVPQDESKDDVYVETIGKLEKVRKRIDAIASCRHGWNGIFTKMTVLPLEIRSAIRKDLKTRPYVLYDLERMYARVVTRNTRLKKLMEIEAPEIVILNESRMLQEYVTTLLDKGTKREPWIKEPKDACYRIASLKDIVVRNTSFGLTE